MTRVIQKFTRSYLPPNPTNTCLYSTAAAHHYPLASTHCANRQLSLAIPPWVGAMLPQVIYDLLCH